MAEWRPNAILFAPTWETPADNPCQGASTQLSSLTRSSHSWKSHPRLCSMGISAQTRRPRAPAGAGRQESSREQSEPRGWAPGRVLRPTLREGMEPDLQSRPKRWRHWRGKGACVSQGGGPGGLPAQCRSLPFLRALGCLSRKRHRASAPGPMKHLGGQAESIGGDPSLTHPRSGRTPRLALRCPPSTKPLLPESAQGRRTLWQLPSLRGPWW